MTPRVRSIRRALNVIASNNESIALLVMRAASPPGDQFLCQQLLNAVHQLNQNADDLRKIRGEIEGFHIRRS